MRLLAGQYAQGVGQQLEDGGQALNRGRRRTREVDDQSVAPRPGDAARKRCQRARAAHDLAQARGMAVEDFGRSFGREVPGAEAGAPRGDNEACLLYTSRPCAC